MDGDDDDRSQSSDSSRSRGGSVKMQIRTMPGWQKLVLTLALLASALGAAGWVAGRVGERANREAAAQAAGDAAAPPGASKFVTRSGNPDGSAPVAAAEEPGFAVRISPKVMRIGVSVIIGFMIGFLFRMFVKTMLLVTLVIGGIFFALTYFNVVNVDLTAAQHTYDNAREWLTDQATRLKDVVVAHLPSSASGGLGAFIGFRRR